MVIRFATLTDETKLIRLQKTSDSSLGRISVFGSPSGGRHSAGRGAGLAARRRKPHTHHGPVHRSAGCWRPVASAPGGWKPPSTSGRRPDATSPYAHHGP